MVPLPITPAPPPSSLDQMEFVRNFGIDPKPIKTNGRFLSISVDFRWSHRLGKDLVNHSYSSRFGGQRIIFLSDLKCFPQSNF